MSEPSLEREALALFEAMLDVPEEERDRWIASHTAGLPELAARVAAMREADSRAALRTGAAADAAEEEQAPERIGAYRIMERIGRGGMGSVYRAERDTGDFAHVAAIKVIKPGLLSEKLIERFARERQTLASLSHPHIAQLYDGGQTETGSPYIVMEYVDGLPLLQWIEERAPDRETRRRLFADICEAVGFANANLIVHRDLTPSNVLVTGNGKVKLIDFGIAKPVDAGRVARELPSIGSLSLTPGYAAPERMKSAEVSTAADIYSLGRLLEKILPPGPKDDELRAIIARATAADPEARYATAEALGRDVDAWHRGLPVSAMPQSRRYRLRKFVGRHRLGVGAGSAAVLLLVGALVVTLLANGRAERARAEAERRFEQTRAIAKALLFDAYDGVSRVPGSTSARALLAQTGLRYLDALAADPAAPVDVRVEAGHGYIRLAQVTGGGQQGQLGRFADAATLLGKAQAIADALAKTHPDDPAVRRLRASLLVEQSATSLYNSNDTEAARTQAREAQALLRPDAGADPEAARLYILAVQSEGDSQLWIDDFAGARTTHLKGESFFRGLPPALQRHHRVLGARSANLRLLGEAHHKLQETEPARKALDEAVAINRALVAAQPDDPALWRKLVVSLRYRAIVHRTNERDELARASIEEASSGARMLHDRDPNDAGALQLFTLVSEVQGQILADLGRFPESYAIGEEGLAAHRRLVALAGNAPGARRTLAQARRTDGGNHYNGGDYAGACRIWAEALAIFEDLERRGELSESDRKNALAEMRDYSRRTCNPPRAGLGPSL